MNIKKVENNYYDEEVELNDNEPRESESEEIAKNIDNLRGDSPPSAHSYIDTDDEEEDSDVLSQNSNKTENNKLNRKKNIELGKESISRENVEEEDCEDDEENNIIVSDNEENFATSRENYIRSRKNVLNGVESEKQILDSLNVSGEVKELFNFTASFQPQDFDLETQLKCFIPDFIPAIGDIDAFIKIPRPDLKPDSLGLVALDEPSVELLSDPRVLDLQLRAISKSSTNTPHIVHSIEVDENSKKTLDDWLNNVQNLHLSKPPPSVTYSRRMPDVESLMQAWDTEIENSLHYINLPTAEINLNLKDFIKVISSVVDIPIYGNSNGNTKVNDKNSSNYIQSLHVLFSLYSEFKNSQHFNGIDSTALNFTNSDHVNNINGDTYDNEKNNDLKQKSLGNFFEIPPSAEP
ncbi:Intraflagellar transport protein 46 [Clydaea vesicula]|uniref:Intraflagellar transport protein 46 n=1 Tax=Clydaea vesicula TaxID=447962 RepID=A0AAD5U671_9FUNG|nr:Intraflagellar transport protein 46 [Clydaea vesicula]